MSSNYDRVLAVKGLVPLLLEQVERGRWDIARVFSRCIDTEIEALAVSGQEVVDAVAQLRQEAGQDGIEHQRDGL